MRLTDSDDTSIALVVDDNPESLGMVSTALEQNGMTVLVATDGRFAIELTRRVEPDVILMDAVMPNMNGFETCRALKSGPNAIVTPIVFMTGLTEKEHIVEGLNAGGVDYITKPVVVEELIARVTTHILNSRLLRSARSALDTSGRSILAFDRSGALLWGSENAVAALDRIGPAEAGAQLAPWIGRCAQEPVSSVPPVTLHELALHFIGRTPSGEVLVKVVPVRSGPPEARLMQAFGLTPREAEIVYWLTLGKTNRDISAILDLSARTVNKHLEQVFQKMGIDNRTSAAVIADRVINRED